MREASTLQQHSKTTLTNALCLYSYLHQYIFPGGARSRDASPSARSPAPQSSEQPGIEDQKQTPDKLPIPTRANTAQYTTYTPL